MKKWNIDPVHSEVIFKVKHLVVSTVTGRFNSFEAIIESEKEDFTDAKISFRADVNSIDTKNEQRDQHLKSADFFNAAKEPEIKFESKSIRKISDNELEVTGDLTIRGIKRNQKLKVIYNGTVNGFGDIKVAGFEIHGKVNRFDYGLHWNALTEAGGVVVSSEVKIEIMAEFNLEQSAAKAA